MKTTRILNHPILGPLHETDSIKFTFNGDVYQGFEGDTIASALLANNIRVLRHHEESGSPRGFYCNIGHCFECRVHVHPSQVLRACLTPIQEGMVIHSLDVLPTPFSNKEDVE